MPGKLPAGMGVTTGYQVTLRHGNLLVTADIKPVSDRVVFWPQAASKCTGLMWIPYNLL